MVSALEWLSQEGEHCSAIQRGKSPGRSGRRNTLAAMLKPEERVILDFERAWWIEPGPKDQAIEFALGLSAAAYYEVLLGLLNDEVAFEYDPLTVKRVRTLVENPIGKELAI